MYWLCAAIVWGPGLVGGAAEDANPFLALSQTKLGINVVCKNLTALLENPPPPRPPIHKPPTRLQTYRAEAAKTAMLQTASWSAPKTFDSRNQQQRAASQPAVWQNAPTTPRESKFKIGTKPDLSGSRKTTFTFGQRQQPQQQEEEEEQQQQQQPEQQQHEQQQQHEYNETSYYGQEQEHQPAAITDEQAEVEYQRQVREYEEYLEKQRLYEEYLEKQREYDEYMRQLNEYEAAQAQGSGNEASEYAESEIGDQQQYQQYQQQQQQQQVQQVQQVPIARRGQVQQPRIRGRGRGTPPRGSTPPRGAAVAVRGTAAARGGQRGGVVAGNGIVRARARGRGVPRGALTTPVE
jgi:hypothetical protein